MSASDEELSAVLRRLRRTAGLSGVAAARAAGMSQAAVSRFETGRQVPTDAQVTRLAHAYGASRNDLRRLRSLVDDLSAGTVRARVVLQRGASRMQQRIGRLEAASARVRSFHPTVIGGLVQTEAYARALLSGALDDHELQRTVTARLDRRRALDDREVVAVHTEGALRWHVGSPDVMAEQCEHLAELTEHPRARIGIVPWTRPTSTPVLHSFHLYDERAVVIGTETATAVITDPRDVADYASRFRAFHEMADFGAVARRNFQRLAAEYRALD